MVACVDNVAKQKRRDRKLDRWINSLIARCVLFLSLLSFKWSGNISKATNGMQLWNAFIHSHVKNKWKTTGFLLCVFETGLKGCRGSSIVGFLGEGGQAAALLAQICCSEEVGGGWSNTTEFPQRKAHTVFFTLYAKKAIFSDYAKN